MKTNERRNRELLGQLTAAIRNVWGGVGDVRGDGDSLYVNVGLGAWEGSLCISDHDQPAGAGGVERHGVADISVRVRNGVGAHLECDENGDIIRVPLSSVVFGENVPTAIRRVVAAKVERYATVLEIRRQVSARAAATRKAARLRTFTSNGG